jgi:hypothetical protein
MEMELGSIKQTKVGDGCIALFSFSGSCEPGSPWTRNACSVANLQCSIISWCFLKKKKSSAGVFCVMFPILAIINVAIV